MKSKVPILHCVPDEQAERDRLVEFTFFVHNSDVARIKEFARVNGIEISVKGTEGRATVLESQFDSVRKFLTGETEFEDFLELVNNKTLQDEIIETCFAVPAHNKTLLQELKDYASKHHFRVSIKGTVATAEMPVKIFGSDHFRKLALKLEAEFENELWRSNNMKENKEKFGKGWHEDKEEVLTDKGLKNKAPRHREAAIKNKYSSTLRTPFDIKGKEDQEIEATRAVGNAEELSDEIIEEVQSKRKPSAISEDNAPTAEKVGSKGYVEDLVSWVRNPNKSDLKEVDTDEDEVEE